MDPIVDDDGAPSTLSSPFIMPSSLPEQVLEDPKSIGLIPFRSYLNCHPACMHNQSFFFKLYHGVCDKKIFSISGFFLSDYQIEGFYVDKPYLKSQIISIC